MKASDGYFIAKRQMLDALDSRIESYKFDLSRADYNTSMKIIYQIKELEEIRSYVKNVLLWDTSLGE